LGSIREVLSIIKTEMAAAKGLLSIKLKGESKGEKREY